jgi:Resolvase, N terminal domain
VPRWRALPVPANGSNLPVMVGAVIYVRVSTKEQTENLSLPTQLRACEEYCRRQGYESSNASTKKAERQVYRSQPASEPAHVLPIEQGPRAFRGRVQPDAIRTRQVRSHLQSLGISLRSATEPIDDTSTGKLMEGVLAAFAQFDNDVRSDRTRAGMRATLEFGRWTLLAPIGYLNAPRAMGKSLMHDLSGRRWCAAKAIQDKLDRLDEAFLFERSIDIETHDRHAEKLREELTLVRIERHSGQLEELDVEGILAFAERVLPRAADLWVQASLEQRQRFQQLFFPERIAFDGKRFVRTATAPALSYLRETETGNEGLVASFRQLEPARRMAAVG